MESKEKSEEKIRQYFIESTKEILKGEGLNAVSVRNIAQKTGYSYATIYNYFKNANALIFACVEDFQKEVEKYVKEKVVSKKTGKKSMREKLKAYTDYFVEYPGIFELFYLEKTGSLAEASSAIEQICVLPEQICQKEWKSIEKKGKLSIAEIDLKKKQINKLIPGLLLTYLNRQCPGNHKEFIALRDELIESVI